MKQATRLPQWPRPWRGLPHWLRWHMLAKPALLLLTAGMLTMLVFFNLDYTRIGASTERFQPNLPAPRDVYAPRGLDWTDWDETERRMEEAANRVPVQYVKDPTARSNALKDLDILFDLLGRPSLSNVDLERLDKMHVPLDLVKETRSFNAATWNQLRYVASDILPEVMEMPLKEGIDEQKAYRQIDALAAMRETEPLRIRVVSTVTRAALRPVYRKDVETTQQLRKDEQEKVQRVVTTLKRGDIVLRRGKIVSQNEYDQLKTLQLLTPSPLVRLLPVATLMLFSLALLGLYLRTFSPSVYDNNRKLVLLALLIIAPVWATMTLGADERHAFLVGLIAVPAGIMAVTGLLGAPVATVTAMMTSITAGLTAGQQFPMTLLLLGSSLTGIMAVSAIWPARRTIPGVLSLVAVNLGLLLIIEGLRPGSGFQAILVNLGDLTLWASAGAIGAVFTAVGAIYMLARPFGITTHYRLMELSNPNEPLLRRLMIEAPGTYHSSVMVANMAEAAADAINANPLFTRVAALYHDIGKLKRPAFFVENQAPLGLENVHQKLSPKLSYLILTSHVRDGVETGRHYKLPEEVIAIIGEHHGTTLAAYFYHRALNEAGGDPISEHEFRYPGPKPSTRESAVVMLSDSVQAAVKAIKDPLPSRIENMVQEIINNRLEDGQLEDCDITLHDLHRIREVFVRMLSGLYSYTRLEYPDIKAGTRVQAEANGSRPGNGSAPTRPLSPPAPPPGIDAPGSANGVNKAS
ncbi:MAG: HD family phosphohydrolase [Armatimonadota bacterium]